MAFKFRKRIRLFPGCTINFSKSGVSTTLGIKGLSVNIGKKGTYLNTGIPGTGLYDRVKLNSFNGNNDNKIKYNNNNNYNYNVQDNNAYFAIKSDENRDITAEGMQELKEQLLQAYNEKQTLLLNWKKASEARSGIRTKQILLKIFIVGFFMPSIDKELEEAISVEKQALKEYNDFNYEFEFKTDENLDKLFCELSNKFDELSKSDRIWDITDSRFADSYKERKAEGTQIVLRKQVSLKKGQLEFIKSKYDALIFENANGGNIYLYPGFAIMYNGNIENSAFIDYPSFTFIPNIVRFTESDRYIPNDAKQVGRQYRYVNKNGQPDRRYSYNPSYPVMAYGEYTLMSDKGLYEKFEFSNADSAIAFAGKYSEFLEELIKQSNKNKLQIMIENSSYFDNPDNYLNSASKYVKQGFETLRMSDYEYANELFDKALTENENDIIAYLGKLLCEHKVNGVNDLINSVEITRVDNVVKNNFDIGQSENFKKAKELSLEKKNIEMFAGFFHIQLEGLYNAMMRYYSKINSEEEVNVEELKALKKCIEKVNEVFEYKDLKDKLDEIQSIIDESINKESEHNNELNENIKNDSNMENESKSKIGDIVFLIPAILLIYILINNAINPPSKSYYIPNQNSAVVNETIPNMSNGNQSNGNKNSISANNNVAPKTVGWVQMGSDWYYYNEYGVMVANGWINSSGNLYCFGADGKMHKNTWIDYNNQLFYVDETGKMLSNQWVGNRYVGADGVMLRNTITPDGYYVGADGNYVPTNTNNNNKIEETIIRNSNKNNSSKNSSNGSAGSNSGSTNNTSKKISMDYVNPVDVRKSLTNGKSLVISLPIPIFKGNGSEELNNITKSKQNEIFNAFVEMSEDSMQEEETEYGTRYTYISSIDFFKNSITYQDDDTLEIENEGQVNWSNGETDKISLVLTYGKNNGTLEYSID